MLALTLNILFLAEWIGLIPKDRPLLVETIAPSDSSSIRLTLPNPDNEVVGGLKCRALFKLPM